MAGPKDHVETQPPCISRACAIQDCLTKNNYNEDKCQAAIKSLYECCGHFYERYGEEATSVCCPKPKLLQLKLQQLKDAK